MYGCVTHGCSPKSLDEGKLSHPAPCKTYITLAYYIKERDNFSPEHTLQENLSQEESQLIYNASYYTGWFFSNLSLLQDKGGYRSLSVRVSSWVFLVPVPLSNGLRHPEGQDKCHPCNQ